MTGIEFFDLLMGRLAGRTSADLRAKCLLEAKLKQQELEGGDFLPWFLITEEAKSTLIVDERRLEIPSDFLRELDDEGGLEVINEAGKRIPLIRKGYDELLNWHGPDTTAAVPENYALVGKYFLLFPIPKLALTVKMRYYSGQPLVNDDGVETTWLKYAADWLLAETGYMVATKHLSWSEKGQEFQTDIGKAKARLVISGVARDEANRERSMG